MKIRRVIRRATKDGEGVAGAVNAVVSANVDEPGSSKTRVSSHQRIVQRNGRTVVDESHTSFEDGSERTTSKEKRDD